MRILLIEDDERIIEVVTAILNEQNYVVDVAQDGEAGWELIESFPYDLVLLDIVLPRLDGIALCRRLRSQKKQVLVMLLTARDTTTDKLLGLDAGADDYVVKPFDPRELAARIRALLRRGNMITTSVLTCNKLQLDPNSCEVTYDSQLLRFSRKEYLLLELFLRHQHRVFSRSAIVDQIWSFNEDPPNEDTVKSHIKSIRRKLDTVGAGDLIETLYGQGYRINPLYLTENRAADLSPTQQQTLETSVAEIWQRTRHTSLQQIDLLMQTAQAFQTATLDLDLQKRASQIAHKLAGSLGTFGFDEGSRLAQQLELLLAVNEPLIPAVQQQLALQVEQIVTALQHILEAATPPGLLASQGTASQATTSQATAKEGLLTQKATKHLPLLLIVDRDREFTQSIVAQAVEYQLRTKVVTTVNAAQKQCQRERPDLAILDGLMIQSDPRRQAFIAGLQSPPAVPIVFLSTQASAKDRVEAIHTGSSLFLQKSLSPTAILQAIVEFLLHKPEPFKVLVVDDDPLITAILKGCLEPQGIQLTGLTDSTQLWDQLNEMQPDLLILDVNMPDINGFELCQTVRHDPQWNWLPIMFLTAQADFQTQQQAFMAGADDLLIKPIEPTELSTRVLNRLQRSQAYRNFRGLAGSEASVRF